MSRIYGGDDCVDQIYVMRSLVKKNAVFRLGESM